jgi:hypothetical protein
MRYWQLSVLMCLIYVTLDLSLPAMPGAFEFDPEESTESIQVRADAIITPPALARRSVFAMVQTRPAHIGPLRIVNAAQMQSRHIVSRQSVLPDDVAPAPEDPH